MKKFIFIMVLTLMIFSTSLMANTTYTFQPNDRDIADLPHDKYFTWGISFTLPQDEEIIGAKLTYKNIWDWRFEQDHLYTRLLDTAPLGLKSYTDNQGGGIISLARESYSVTGMTLLADMPVISTWLSIWGHLVFWMS